MSAASNWCAQNSRCRKRPAQIVLGAFFAIAGLQAIADTYTYQAITDFDDINAGEVPYYVDTVAGRNVLAIDAAVVTYREKFARATTMFTGDSGTFDVTITTLGEIDGEGEFRFLVNGEVVGSAVNYMVDEDWGEQFHVFPDIEIVSGDEISVESDARSNGLIPENGEYAFARGRWRELALIADDAATANPVSTNLSVAVAAQPEQAELADLVAVVVSVRNLSANSATNPVVLVTPGAGLQFVSGDGCDAEAIGGVITCALEEVAATSVALTGLAFVASATGDTTIAVEVSADQTDSDLTDNTAVAEVEVITGDNIETITSTVTSGATTVASGAVDAVSQVAIEATTGATAETTTTSTDVATAESTQDSAPSESAAATGASSSGGSARPSIVLHLALLLGLALRFARVRL